MSKKKQAWSLTVEMGNTWREPGEIIVRGNTLPEILRKCMGETYTMERRQGEKVTKLVLERLPDE